MRNERSKLQRGRPSTASLYFIEKLRSLRRRKILRELYTLCVKDGITAYLVGGTVRNCMLSTPLEPDYDFAVKGDTIRLGAKLAKKTGGASFILDKEINSSRVVVKGPRHATVVDLIPLNGDNITEDLLKRDFTVNAMAVKLADLYSKAGGRSGLESLELIDPCNGAVDAHLRLLRMITSEAFIDDPLRSLRALRLSCQYHFMIEPKTRDAIKRNSALLKCVSAERIRDEIVSLFSHDDAPAAVSEIFGMKLADAVFPELADWTDWTDSPPYDLLGHTLKVMVALQEILRTIKTAKFSGYDKRLAKHLADRVAGPTSMTRAAQLSIAAFLHDAGKLKKMSREDGRLRFIGHDLEGSKIAYAIMKRLKFSSAAATDVAALVRNHHRLFDLARLKGPSDRARAHFFRAMGGKAGLDLIMLAISDAAATKGKPDETLNDVAREMFDYYYNVYARSRPKPLFSGLQVMKTFGVEQGARVGEILSLIAQGVDSGAVVTKKQAIEYVRKNRSGP